MDREPEDRAPGNQQQPVEPRAPAPPPEPQALPPALPDPPQPEPVQPVARALPRDEVHGLAPPGMTPPQRLPGQLYIQGALYLPAGFWPRLGAFLIDAVILYIAHQIALQVIGFSGPSQEQALQALNLMMEELMTGAMPSDSTLALFYDLQRPLLFIGWLNVFTCMAYFTVFHGLLGATLGKLSLGLRVMRRDGKPLGFGWALLRYLCYFIVAKLLYTAWLIPFNAERRTFYDMVLGTNVFRQAPRVAPLIDDGQRMG